MTSAAYSSHPALAVTADLVIPLLGALALLFPAIAWRTGWGRKPYLLWSCGFASVALLYLVRYIARMSGAWAALGYHFSSHTGLAISFAVTLIAFRLSFLPAVSALVCGYLWLITDLHYHVPGDIFTTAAIVLPLSLLCHVPWWKTAPAKRTSR